MTAERWWVRLAARWMARANAVQSLVQMAMLALTGVSTGLVALETYGYGAYAWHLIAAVGVGTVVFAYLYTEGGVYNQQRRDFMDYGTNYAHPRVRIDREIEARALFAAMHGRVPEDGEREVIEQAVEESWRELRDGVDIDGGAE